MLLNVSLWFHAKVHWWILEWTVWQLSLSGQYCRCILQWSKFWKNTAHVTLQRDSLTQERPATAIGGEVAIFTDVWLSHHEGWELCAFIYGYIDLLEASLCFFVQPEHLEVEVWCILVKVYCKDFLLACKWSLHGHILAGSVQSYRWTQQLGRHLRGFLLRLEMASSICFHE